MSEVNELRERRRTLEAELSALCERRERAFRVNSDALALQRAGVTHHDATAMERFAADEVAGDSTMTDVRRRIELTNTELARLGGKGRRIMRWLRK
jgi:hypothetical protein